MRVWWALTTLLSHRSTHTHDKTASHPEMDAPNQSHPPETQQSGNQAIRQLHLGMHTDSAQAFATRETLSLPSPDQKYTIISIRPWKVHGVMCFACFAQRIENSSNPSQAELQCYLQKPKKGMLHEADTRRRLNNMLVISLHDIGLIPNVRYQPLRICDRCCEIFPDVFGEALVLVLHVSPCQHPQHHLVQHAIQPLHVHVVEAEAIVSYMVHGCCCCHCSTRWAEIHHVPNVQVR